MTASIRFTQRGITAPDAEMMSGAPGVAVLLSSKNNTNVTRWKYEVLSVPTGSGVSPSVLSDGVDNTATFTPDVSFGCYRVRLTTTNSSGVVTSNIGTFSVPSPNFGWTIPAHGSTDLELFDGVNTQGYAALFAKFMQHVDVELTALLNIDALRSVAAPTLGMPRRVVSGYYLHGDGGGGEFVWDAACATADNGGTVIKPDSIAAGAVGRWIRVFSGPVNVRWFGAKGNGSANDTASFAAAINSGSVVYIPLGDFIIRSQLPKVGTVVGESMAGSRVMFYPTDPDLVLFDCSPADITINAYYWLPSVSNLTIVGSGAVKKTALRMWHGHQGNIHNVQVNFSSGTGDTSDSTALNMMGCDEFLVSNCIFYASRPILAENQPTSPRNNLDHVTFQNCGLYGDPRHPLIEFQIGSSQVTFIGRQPWVGGASAFYLNNCYFSNLTFHNIRYEGGSGVFPAMYVVGRTYEDNGVTTDIESGLTISHSRFGVYNSKDAIYLRFIMYVLLEDIISSIGSTDPENPVWPALYNVDGTCIHVTAINCNAYLGGLWPKVGSDLKLALSVGGTTGNNALPVTRFYTSTRPQGGGAVAKPYVGIMDTLMWSTCLQSVVDGGVHPLTSEVTKASISTARVEVTVFDTASPLTINGSATFDIIVSGASSFSRLVASSAVGGVTFGVDSLSAGEVGIVTTPYAVNFSSAYPGELTAAIRVMYYTAATRG